MPLYLLILFVLLLLLWSDQRNRPDLMPTPPLNTRSLKVLRPTMMTQSVRFSSGAEESIEAAREELQQERAAAQALLKLGSELPRESDLDVVLDKALELVCGFLNADRGFILLDQGEDENFLLRAKLGGDHPLPSGGQPSSYPRNKGMLGWMMQYGRPILVPDLSQDDRWQQAPNLNAVRRSAIGAPLIINQEPLGVLLFTNHQPNAFNQNQLPVVLAAASQVANAVYNRELFNLIRDQAARQGGMIREKRIEASKSNAILESIAEGVLVTDDQNQVVMLNAAAERILKLDRQQVIGGPISNFIGIYAEVGDRWQQAVQEWSSFHGGGDEQGPPLEARLTLDDDRIVSFSLAPVQFEGRFLGTVSTFRDITREVEVDRLKSEFVATVSHELRTPMTSVKGYVEMLLMEAVGEINDQQRRFLKVIKNNIDRLGSLVNDLLDISRIEAGRVQLDLENLNVATMLEESVEIFKRRTRLESKPMTIELELPHSLPLVKADRDRLRQIIANLMENSFNYTPIDGRIQLSANELDDLVEVNIKDNGIGISPEDRERVFERFFRGDQALNMAVAGTGLGLSIVRQLVEMHGGSISLESSGVPGEGTSFSFTLPIAEQDQTNRTSQ